MSATLTRSRVQGIFCRKLNVCVTWLSISPRSVASRLPLRIERMRASSGSSSRPALAADVVELARRELLQILEIPLRQHGRLVRLRDEREVLLQPLDLARAISASTSRANCS